jgi:plastocyanin
VLSSLPLTILLNPGGNLSYASLEIVPLPSALEGGGGLNGVGYGDELVALNATAPSGLALHFYGSNLASGTVLYEEVSVGSTDTVLLQLAATPNAAPGTYNIAVEASSGSLSVHYSIPVHVVQYMVAVMGGDFSPAKLNVTAGTTVYWMNLDLDSNYPCQLQFPSLNLQSPNLMASPLYQYFSYTFTTDGNYSYTCQQYISPPGTVTVTG